MAGNSPSVNFDVVCSSMKKAPEGISKASCVITGILGGKAHFVACVRSNLVHEQRMNKEIELREDLSPRKYAPYFLVRPPQY